MCLECGQFWVLGLLGLWLVVLGSGVVFLCVQFVMRVFADDVVFVDCGLLGLCLGGLV